MNFPNISIFSTSNSKPFTGQMSFGESKFNNSYSNQPQTNKIDLFKQPDSLRKQNIFSSFDNQGNLFTSTHGMETIYQQNPIDKELIKSFSSAFSQKTEQIMITNPNSFKTFSHLIRSILSEKAKSNAEYNPYLVQFSIFDFFLVNNDNLLYKFKIRDELIFKLFSPDINKFELFKSNDSNNISKNKSTIEIQIHRITFLLLICDFSQAIPLITSLIDNIQISKLNYIQTNFREYIDFFMNLGRFCELYSDILKESNSNYTNVEAKMETLLKEVTFEMERIVKGIKANNDNKTFNSLLMSILLLIKGDPNTITKLLNENNLNWYFILLCHIYYRGYQIDFFDILKNFINSSTFKPEDHLEKDLVNIINKSHVNQLEAIKGLKGKVPFILYFAMLSILHDMELIDQIDDSFDIYKYEYNEFLNSLFNYDITLDDFISYFFGYIDTSENCNMIFIHNFAVKNVEEIFHKQLSIEDMKTQIDLIKLNIKRFQMMKDSLIIINKICFYNYLRLNNYQESFQAYFDYNRLISDRNDNASSNNTVMISDPILSDRHDMFDLVLSMLLSNDGQWEPLADACIWMSEKKDLPANADFLWKYVNFHLRIRRENENLNNICNEFFGYCFVQQPYPGCPAMLWLFVLNEIKEQIENKGLSLIKESAALALDNLLLYEDAIKRKAEKYWKNKNMTISELFEELTNYLFETKTDM